MSAGLYSVLLCLFFSLQSVAEQNIVLFHARKAGGSTIFRWIQQFKQTLNHSVNIIHIEAYPAIHHQGRNAIQFLMDKYKDNALFIVVFREPIARIVSQYDFEWKWGCQHCDVRDVLPQSNLNRNNFMKSMRFFDADSYRYKFANIEIGEFLDRVEEFEINDINFGETVGETVKDRNEHWFPYSVYVRNYYPWILCCDDILCRIDDMDHTECLETARKMIESMDLVIITEWMEDRRNQIYFNQILYRYLLNQIDKRLNFNSSLMISPPERPPDLHGLSAYSTMLSRADHERLIEWNQLDLKLYAFARNLSFQCLSS